MSRGTVECQRLSRPLSECQPLTCIATKAVAYGTTPSSCRSPKLRKSLKLVHVTCYMVPPYRIHFKCVLNFGERQPEQTDYCAKEGCCDLRPGDAALSFEAD
jgi:hypothetical protein